MAIFDMPSSPLRFGSQSPELGSAYRPPESFQRETALTNQTSPGLPGNTLSTPQVLTNSNIASEDGGNITLAGIHHNNPSPRTGHPSFTNWSASSYPIVSRAAEQEENFTREVEVPLQLQANSKLPRPATRPPKKKQRAARVQGSQDNPVFIKSESDDDNEVDAAVKKAEAKKVAKREKRNKQIETEREHSTAISSVADLTQGPDAQADLLSEPEPSQNLSAPRLNDERRPGHVSHQPETPRKKKFKVKREKSATPATTSPRKQRKTEWLARHRHSKKPDPAKHQSQLPTPPGSTPSNGCFSSQSAMRRSGDEPTSRPQACQESIAELYQQSQVQAALKRDKQVRTSASAPALMTRLIGVTGKATCCDETVIDLTTGDGLISDNVQIERESWLTSHISKERLPAQQAELLIAKARERQGASQGASGRLHPQQHQPRRWLQHHDSPSHTGRGLPINVSKTKAAVQAHPQAPQPRLRRSSQHVSTLPLQSARSSNILEPHSSSHPDMLPSFNQRMIALRSRLTLPNPGRRPWLPVSSLRQRTPAEWHSLGQASSATHGGVDKARLDLLPSRTNRSTFKLNANAFKVPTLSETESFRQSPPKTLASVTTSGTSDSFKPASSRSPTVESSYLLWGSVRMRTTWEEDEPTVVNHDSDDEVSDGLEILHVPKPVR